MTMADISAFRAYRYNPTRVRLDDVVTQPYDKISPAMQERYLAASPANLITVEKGKPQAGDDPSNNVYTRAEQALESWIKDSILLQDAKPGIYVYFQEYTVPAGCVGSGERRTRKGFIALGRVEDYSANVVFRHEQTLSGPKADRLELLRKARTHTGQLFMLYTDPERRVDAILDAAASAAPAAEISDEYDVTHRLWPVFDEKIIASVVSAMAEQKLVIADGHHRYETALAYRDECRKQAGTKDPAAPYERAMMTFFNTRSEGLLILPTHRVVANVPGFDPRAFRNKMAAVFEQEHYSLHGPMALAAIRRDLVDPEGKPIIGMYTQTSGAGEDAHGELTLFHLRPEAELAALLPDVSEAQRQLDLVLLHRLLLEKGLGITPAAVKDERNLTYEREMPAAIAAVDEGRAQACFLLNPIGVEQVTGIALAGEVLPQKSTDFYPKLLSGLTLYRLG